MEQPPRSKGHIHTQMHPCLWLIQLYVPNTFRKIAWVFHVPQESVKSCEREPTVFRWKAPTEISFSVCTKKKRVLLHGETQALMLAHTKTVRSFPWFLYFVSSYRTSCHLALHWDLEKSIASGSPLTYDISLKQVNTFSFPKIRLSKIRSPLRCYDNGMGTRKKSRWGFDSQESKVFERSFFRCQEWVS